MKVIYVSGKYTGTAIETERNITAAKEAAVKLIARGWAVITPHLNTANFEKFEKDYPNITYKTYMDIDIELLKRCDAIFMLDGFTHSKGAMIELECAMAIFEEENIYFQKDGYPLP